MDVRATKIAGHLSLGTGEVLRKASGSADKRSSQDTIWTRARSGRTLVARTQKEESRG